MNEEKKEKLKKNRAKIIVESGDELTDLLRKIAGINDENILLTFAEESDLLISPINLKVLQEVCDESNKNLILQIIQNPTGIRNSKIAEVITTESPSDVDDDLWFIAEKKRLERREQRKIQFENKKGGMPGIEDTKEAIEDLNRDSKPILQDSEYQERIQQVIEKAKDSLQNQSKKIIKDEGLTFAIGQDIDDNAETDLMLAQQAKEKSFIGKNFNNISELKKIRDKNDKKPKFEPPKKDYKEEKKPQKPKREKKPITAESKKAIKKKLIIALVLLLGSLGIAGAFAYYTLPLVEVEIYIESKSIEVEKNLRGNTNIETLNLEDGEIPIRLEEITVSRSENANTTGTGTRGNKAEGVITIQHWGVDNEGDEFTISAGTTVISQENVAFEITRNVEVPEAPNQVQGVPVRAIEPGGGDEYNLASGNIFTVSEYGEEVTAINTTRFSGGLSEEYPKLTKEDYDKLRDSLKKDAFESGIRQLEDSHPGWILLEDSIKQDLEGDVNTDIPIDGEGSMFNMSLSTKSTGLYYNREEILDAKEEIIKKAAFERDLFQNDGDLKLELDEDIETEITIESIDGNTVSIKFIAKGYVRVDVDTEEIRDSLLGKSWEEGKSLLEKTDYSEKSPDLVFLPDYFPQFLYHFPSRENRILIETELIETETLRDENEESEDPEEEETE